MDKTIDRLGLLRRQIDREVVFLVTLSVTGLDELNELLGNCFLDGEFKVVSIHYGGLNEEEEAEPASQD
jgi:hypothetical protein